MKRDEVTEKKESGVNELAGRYYPIQFIMTGVREIATALICCFGRIYGVFYALNLRRNRGRHLPGRNRDCLSLKFMNQEIN